VVTIVAYQSGIDIEVTGPGPLPGPHPSPTPTSSSPSPSASATPTEVRTPSRIDTGAGGAAPDTRGLPSAALVASALTAGAMALVARSARSVRRR